MRIKYQIIFLISLIVCWPRTQVSANTEIAEFYQALNTIPSYEVTYRLRNNRSNTRMSEARILVDNHKDSAVIQLNYYLKGPGKQAHHYQLDLIAYDHFKRIYINQGQLLSALSQYQTLKTSDNHRLSYQGPSDTYSLLPQVSNKIAGTSLNQLFILLPDQDKLTKRPELIQELNDTQLKLSGTYTQLPEFAFDHSQLLQLSYQLEIAIKENNKTELIPHLSLKPSNKGLDLKSVVYLTHADTNDLAEWWERQNPDTPTQLIFDLNSSQIIRKLTHLVMQMNQAEGTYQLDLTGVVEKVLMNLWTNKTAGMRTYDFSVDYQLELKPVEIPSENQLNLSSWDQLAQQVKLE